VIEIEKSARNHAANSANSSIIRPDHQTGARGDVATLRVRTSIADPGIGSEAPIADRQTIS
jgi:hypothetical protein